jgi:hypothetical protein
MMAVVAVRNRKGIDNLHTVTASRLAFVAGLVQLNDGWWTTDKRHNPDNATVNGSIAFGIRFDERQAKGLAEGIGEFDGLFPEASSSSAGSSMSYCGRAGLYNRILVRHPWMAKVNGRRCVSVTIAGEHHDAHRDSADETGTSHKTGYNRKFH